MHRRPLLMVGSLFATLLPLFFVLAAGPRDAEWKQVNNAISSGKPKTAITHLDPIIQNAMDEKKYAEAIKAIALKISLEGTIQGNRAEEKITRMEEEIAKAPEEMKPMMQAILANWYWQYFQQNRWRFANRTQADAPIDDDITTWDLPRILSEIDRRFQLALDQREVLQKTSVTDYDDLLEKGNAPDSYRPTLYDFVAQDAIQFYSSGEQAGSRVIDAFELQSDSPIFGRVSDFIAWDPETDDDDSLNLKAVRLFQDLLRFHQSDDDPSALLDADLGRLVYGYNQAVGDEKEERFEAALGRFIKEHGDHPISSRAQSRLATLHQQNGELVEAHKVASEGLARHPDSVGGRRCFNLIQQIEAKSIRIETERVWDKPRRAIHVAYRNITTAHFRLVRLDYRRMLQSSRWNPEQLDEQQRQALLSAQPIRSWESSLDPTDDYAEQVATIETPDDLALGSYYLIASANAEFNDVDNVVMFTPVWRSNLALVTRNHRGDGRIDGFVLDAESGEPISGAEISGWQRVQGRGNLVNLPATRTDANGRFEFRVRDRNALLLIAKVGQDVLPCENLQQTYRSGKSRTQVETLFFTDRAIYRPGQSIHFKGICISRDPDRDSYRTLANRAVTVVFNDANGEKVEELKLRANDFGSISGTVTAPRDRLMGQMTLSVSEGPRGSTSFSVEEYKRPKFRVEVAPPEKQAKLGEPVTIVGNATAYTGASIDNAKVEWRVVRQVQYPIWWYWRCWWLPPDGGASQEIATGTSATDAMGAFEISFDAKPDLSAPEESEPVFQYTIYADVTDTTGETRSDSRTINLGYTALAATLSADDWQTTDKPVAIRIQTKSLDGEPRGAKGKITIYSLKQPDRVERPTLINRPRPYAGGQAPDPDLSNPNAWPLGEAVHESEFETDASGTVSIATKLAEGMYRAKLESTDAFGKAISAELPVQVIDPDAEKLAIKVPQLYATPSATVEPGEEYTAIWGSGYDSARVFVEVEHRGQLLKSYWSDAGTTQAKIVQEVTEEMRGGFHVRTTMVRENRAYMQTHSIDVPWSNKDLKVTWEHFVSKLQPAAKEVWTAVVKGPNAEGAVAEMVATLYDASLDAYRPNRWPSFNGMFRRDHSQVQMAFENSVQYLRGIRGQWTVDYQDGSLTYRHYPREIAFEAGRMLMRGRAMAAPAAAFDSAMADDYGMEMSMEAPARAKRGQTTMDFSMVGSEIGGGVVSHVMAGEESKPDLSNVSPRTNLNETAFFFPHLVSSEDGTVRMEFTMPEALTEWRFIGFAHDQKMRFGRLDGTTVTAKDLMVQPNPPRFLREGDVIDFTVKISNQSPTHQTGTARLTFNDARTGDSVDAKIGNSMADQEFDIAAGQSKTLAWRLTIPDGLGFVTYRAVGSTGRLSDGEEGMLPVLSRRVLVTESLPLPIRGKGEKDFRFEKLLDSGSSDSLQSQSVTLQMVSNPSWYAVMALPYLMDYPYECSEQTFNRLYANTLAQHIVTSDPKIEKVFARWRATPALDSPLEKNQELKEVMIEETPWLRQAESESQARRNVGILFDRNRLADQTARMMRRLSELQLDDGAWSWFPGGRANDYITLYITTGFGRLRHLGVEIDSGPALRSLSRLDGWMTQRYADIKPEHRDKDHLSSTVALYLYGRTFFLKESPIGPDHLEAWRYWISQARKYWLEVGNRQSQAHLAIALKRTGDLDVAKQIVDSIREHAVTDDEMGMFWRDAELSWWWYRAPIETQSMMIEMFDEVVDDQKAAEDCKVWLLKQKQTQDWKTTKATADAVYALLLRGTDQLASDALVQVSVGGTLVDPGDVEAGTGFYEQRWSRGEIKPDLGEIEVKKTDDGVAWGSMYWQYLEDMSRVTKHDGTPLQLTKQLFVKKNTPKGPTLSAVDGPVEVGDELVVRIVLRTDRDMEYVHLKDYRGSGTEPVNVLSRYKFQDGLAYYESTRDTASHFFIDYLPKGTYVFEYSTRVQLRGEYQTGFANIQCMYAPEFSSHSESLTLNVK